MRQWISLFENIVPASFLNIIPDEKVDDIIATGKWVDHGSDLEDQWDAGSFEYWTEKTHPELVGKSFTEVRNTPQFKDILKVQLADSAKNHYDMLTKGDSYENLPPLTDETKIYRGISGPVSPNYLGVYWSLVRSQSVGRFISEKTGGFLLIAKLKDVTIDWEQTLMSRLDIGHGNDEGEIQLKSGTNVIAEAYRVDFEKYKANIKFANYIHRKA